nr:hypothetical protein [Clostridia bacterium]
MFKKIAAFMLAVLCCAPVFAGCSDNSDTTAADTTAADNAETTVAEETTTHIQADLPETDFGGKELRIYTWTHEETKVQNDFWTPGEDGEPLNDAVFARNAAI